MLDEKFVLKQILSNTIQRNIFSPFMKCSMKSVRLNGSNISFNIANFVSYMKCWIRLSRPLLIKLTAKTRAEKAWLLYEFPFSLNPSDKPDDTQTWKSNLSLYPVITEDQFQENSKKSWGNILGAAK